MPFARFPGVQCQWILVGAEHSLLKLLVLAGKQELANAAAAAKLCISTAAQNICIPSLYVSCWS